MGTGGNADQMNEKLEAFQKLDDLIENIPEIDYDKELAEYREEKYGQ